MATNREQLEEARIITSTAQLTPEQEQAIEDLTHAQVQALIQVQQQVSGVFPASDEGGTAGLGIVQHHH
jgi:hypothetical protein